MRLRKAGVATALILLVGACSGSGGGEQNHAAAPPGPSPEAKMVMDLPEAQRNGVFMRAIRDAQQPCQGVGQSNLVGQPGGAPVYQAACTSGEQYQVTILRNGSAQVAAVPASGGQPK